MSLMVAAKASGANAGGVAIEGHHVVAPRRRDPERRRPCAGPRRAGRSARSRRSAGSRRDRSRASRTRSVPRRLPHRSLVQLTLNDLLKKRVTDAIRQKPLKRHRAVQQPELFEPDAHGDRRDEKLLGEGLWRSVSSASIVALGAIASPLIVTSKRAISTKGWSIGVARLKNPLLAVRECSRPRRRSTSLRGISTQEA